MISHQHFGLASVALMLSAASSAAGQQPGETRLIFEIPITIEGDRGVFDQGIRADCAIGPQESGETNYIDAEHVDVVSAGSEPDRAQYTAEVSFDVPDLADALDQTAVGWICYLRPAQTDDIPAFQRFDGGNAPIRPAQAGTCSYVEGVINMDGTVTAQAPQCAGG